MRLVQFEANGNAPSLGLLKNDGSILDLHLADPTLPTSTLEFLELGEQGLEKVKSVIAAGYCNVVSNPRLLAPLTRPDKLICVGHNYRDHCMEQGVPVPEFPVIFSKFSSCIVGPTDGVLYPEETSALDWEVELAIVIGKRGKKISETEAMQYVFGYTVAMDVSARDWQLKKNSGQWLLGKTMDTFCPIGPAIVTPDEFGDPHNLGIRCKVNGVLKQNSNTNQLVHRTEALVAYISRFVTLLPGDIILSGTPPGVGVFRNPPEYLKKGDVVECEIDSIGKITNVII